MLSGLQQAGRPPPDGRPLRPQCSVGGKAHPNGPESTLGLCGYMSLWVIFLKIISEQSCLQTLPLEILAAGVEPGLGLCP